MVADIFGTNSLELIPAYLLIAETSIGLNKLREAEQQLQKGNFNLYEPGLHGRDKLFSDFSLGSPYKVVHRIWYLTWPINHNYLANWVVMSNENDETIDYVKQGLYRVLGLLHGKI